MAIKHHSNENFLDSNKLTFGTGEDLQILHDGSNSFIHHNNTGDLEIKADTGDIKLVNYANDKDIILKSDDGSGGTAAYLTLDGSSGYTKAHKHILYEDDAKAMFGTGGDMQILHDGSNSYISQNVTGNLYIQQNTNDADIILQCDDGSGGTTAYLTLDGSVVETKFNKDLRVIDNEKIIAGTSNDLEIFSSGADVIFKTWSGNMTFQQNHDDSDIIFQCDDGAGGVATYFTLDGSSATHDGSATTSMYTQWGDNSIISLGDAKDFSMYHTGSKTLLNNNTGNLEIRNSADDSDIIFQCDDGSGGVETYFFLDGSLSSGSPFTTFPDQSRLNFGTGNDMQIYHDGSNTYMYNNKGDLKIMQAKASKDLILMCDDGSGGETAYLTLDGSTAKSYFSTRLGVGIADPVSSLHVEEDSTATSTTAGLTIEQAGTGDAIAQFLLTGVRRWVIGADNSDLDKFKIASSGGLASDAHLTIDTSGNVGIGTTSPTTKLHISDASTPEVRIEDTTNNRYLSLYQNNSNSYVQSSLNSALVLSTHGANERMRITTAGNVGIGTTSPDHLLQVESSGNAEIQAQRASGAGVLIQAQSAVGVVGTNTNHRLDLKTNSSTRATISTSGNFGIGTTSPGEKLDVDGDIKLSGDIELGHASDTTIARSAAGTVTIEGNPIQTTNVHHHFLNAGFFLSFEFARYIPLNGSINEQNTSTSSPEYTHFTWPYDGFVKKMMLRTETDMGSTELKLYKGASGAAVTTALGAVTETVAASNAVEFDFTSVTNTYSKGDTMAVRVDPTDDPDGGQNITIELVFDLTT